MFMNKQAALSEVGAGINIGPNASRILHRLGIAEVLRETGVQPQTFDQRRWDNGHILLRSPLGGSVEAAFDAPYYTLHRGDLHRAFVEVIPADRLHLAHRFTQLTRLRRLRRSPFRKWRVRFSRMPSSAQTEFTRPCVTLCSVRKSRALPAASLTAAWCRLIASIHLGLETTTQIWMGPDRHFVHYFVSAGKLVNFVAVTEEDSWLRESWVDRGEVADALAAFAGWHDQVLSIIGAADETYKWALFDRSPLPRWSAGRVTLLGDSCHPMLPFMGQGAAQAIEDAATLKGCLEKFADDVPEALRLYERLRLPRASRLQGMSEINKNSLPFARWAGANRTRRGDGERRDRLVVGRDCLALRARCRIG